MTHITSDIKRSEIEGGEESIVAVFPSKKSGIQFLKENNAWGFVRIGREFDFAAIYVSENIQEIQYFAKVNEVVSIQDAEIARPLEEYIENPNSVIGKMVVEFEQGSLYELKDPIPFKSKYPVSHQYTTLEDFKKAETTDDILG